MNVKIGEAPSGQERRSRKGKAAVLGLALGFLATACNNTREARDDYRPIANETTSTPRTLPYLAPGSNLPSTTNEYQTTTTPPSSEVLPTTQPNTTTPTTAAKVPQPAIATINNKKFTGPNGPVEDSTPAYLAMQPRHSCIANPAKCQVVSGTDNLRTGSKVALICQTSGEQTTNGSASSNLYYGAAHPNGALGFISTVWVENDGQGVPDCNAIGFTPSPH